MTYLGTKIHNLIDQEAILKLIAKGEGECLDFKEAITSRVKIAKTLAAFANTKGGKLLIGVKDNGRIKGIDPMEEQEMLKWAAEAYISPSISIRFETICINKKFVLVADVEESNQKPHYAMDEQGKKWAYLRVHDQTLKASKVMLDVMRSDTKDLASKIEFGSTEKRLLQFLESNPRITIKEFTKLVNISRRRANQIMVQLVRMRLVKVLSHEKEDYYSL